jgi:polyphosphate kinase 2
VKLKNINLIETPYDGISREDYGIEKRRLQLELLNIQQRVIKKGQRVAIIFEGRDAAGKGATIKRFTEHLIPAHMHIVQLGIPTPKESKYWFKRYEKHFPRVGEMVFFDRSWYSRAMIEPTMEYCTKSQYEYFMKKVLPWEHKQIDNGLILIKFYLSIKRDTQLYRFEDRINNPLSYWKFSENDLKARQKWPIFTKYKEQMFKHCSSDKSPWVIINSNKRKEGILTCMLHLVRSLSNKSFEPLTGEDVTQSHSIKVGGVKFRGLSLKQFMVLQELKHKEELFVDLE